MKTLVTQTRVIPTNDICLHAEVAGPDDGPLVVLLHGFPEHWAGWINQIGPLARSGFRIVAPDQRGYALSDKPEGIDSYRLEILVQDVLGILDHFGREKAVIVGHDWGGVVAWRLALTFPQRLEKLVILNAPHPAAMNRALLNPATGQMLRSTYIYFFQIPRLPERLLSAGNYFLLKRMLVSLGRPGSFTRHEIRRYKEAWSQPGAVTAMLNWYRAEVRGALKTGQVDYLRRSQRHISLPTLILWGELDPALSPQLAQSSLDWCDQGRLVRFPEATHWVQHDEVERVNNRILDFLKHDLPFQNYIL